MIKKYKVSLIKQSVLLGFNEDYLSCLKHQRPSLFRFLEYLGKGNFIKAFDLFKDWINSMKNYIAQYYFKMGEYNFCKYLLKHGFYKSRYVNKKKLDVLLFCIDIPKIEGILKLRQIYKKLKVRYE